MSLRERYSDEILNAFIDGELGVTEREPLLEALSHDPELSRRVCELQKVREMLQLAYEQVPGQAYVKSGAVRRQRSLGQAVAATVLLGVGLVLGWAASLHGQSAPAAHGLFALADTVQKQESALSQDEEWRVVVHVSSGDPQRLARALLETEKLLESSRQVRTKLRLEVLTNAGGVNLLRTDTAPVPQLVQRLQEQFDNISFLACRQALDRLEQEQGISARLLPGTRVVPSVVAQIRERQADGWTYIRI